MSVQLRERAQSDMSVESATAAGSRSSRVTDAEKFPTRRWRAVPLWTGRALQVVAITMLVIALTDVVLPEGVYWAASYFSVLGLSPEPFLFNAVLLFIVGSAAKRRLRGALLFLVVFEIPTVALPLMNFIADAGDVARFTESGGIVDIVAALIAAGVIGMLILMRREFSARSEPASYLGALAVAVTGVVVAVAVGFSIAPSSVSNAEAWWSSLRAATGIYPSTWLVEDATDPLGTAAEFVVSSISAAALLVALWALLRSARRRRLLTDDEERHVRRLLLSGRSDDSLAYFATRRDKSVVFSPNREAAVSYRVVNSVALASGDPLGSPAHWDAAIDEWLQVVERYGWRPAVLAPTESGADHYARHGMRGMALGEEALLHLDAAARDTLLAQPRIRGARRRGRQADYAVRIRRQRDIDDVEMGHIAVAAARWRGGEDERGFSMALSRMADPSDGDNLVVTAYDGEGELRGILVFVPWSHDGCSLDVMRRSPGAINGVTELMVSSLISDSATLGIRRVSLNFAVLRDTLVRGGRVGAGPLLRAKRRILLLLSHHWQLESLRRANEKYQPQWRPRFVMWSRRASFTSVLLAIAIAEGFTGRWGRIAAHAEATRDQRFLDAIEVDRQEALRTGVTGLRPALSARAAGVVRLRAQGIDPYPACVPRSAPLNALPAEVSGPISVAGRVVQRRRHGGILFVDIVEDHARLQVVATRSDTEHYALLARVALGGIVSVTGRLGYTRAGQRSVFVTEWTRASSSLRQPPNAWTGLRDPEAQVRLRHIHLATSPDAAELLRSRSRAVQAMRSTLLDEGYLEVETPILQRTHGGANARPFRTHINAYDRELTLRIAPELALKRLIVAGFTQVFEIGRNFRNEGADSTHNPEFTAMEAYQSFADYEDMRVLAERLIREMAVAVTGAQILVAPDGRRVDVSRPWRVVSVCDALSERMGTTVSPATDIGTLRDLCAVFDVRANPHDGAGTLIELLYEELIEQHTWLPTFYTDFPAETSPLARPHRRTAGLAERWDLVAFGMELGTAYSELVDPMEQRRRLMAQSLRAANGDVEAMQVDEDFLAALEYGMPPTGGLGLGVDRIVMAITGATIRQTLAFPFVR